MRNEIIGIIPARGGSKGIRNKNIKYLAGKPLIVYSIEAALKSKYVDRTFVSTENEEIARIAMKYDVGMINRPTELAKDETPTIDVIFHTLQVLKAGNFEPKIVVLLQPTSPLRNARDIDNALELFMRNDCESVVSVSEAKHSPYWGFKLKDKYLEPIFGEKYLKMRRQELPKVYLPNGAIFISAPETLYKYRSFYCSKTVPYVMPRERGVDIDDEIDFILAELLIKKYGTEKNSGHHSEKIEKK